MSIDTNASVSVPHWVPEDVRNYLLHTVYGQSIRQLARQAGCHASTVLRQVRKIEGRRDDPLTDGALRRLSAGDGTGGPFVRRIEQLQTLRRMAEPGAVLAVARDMENGVIVRDSGDSGPGAAPPVTVELRIAQSLALREWIAAGNTEGRVVRYRITPQGRSGLRELVALSENHARELAEAPAGFAHKDTKTEGDWDQPKVQKLRLSASESPVRALARRKDKDGKPFLNGQMVRAAERLREEFEIAHIQSGLSQDWVRLATGHVDSGPGRRGADLSRMDARARVEAAFGFLGPGLAEVVYRTCCLLEGLEATEQRMGWSARSGKIVLRIALQRLLLHYENAGALGPKIG